MIAFGVCIASQERFEACALPGIGRCAEQDTLVLKAHRPRSLSSAYNDFLDEAALLPDLECLVLLHEDTEILDDHLFSKLRAQFAGEAVAVVGAIGASDVRSLAWWDGRRAGRVSFDGGIEDFGTESRDVEAVDGLFMALSRWAVNAVRFDEATCPGFHGYDVDYCFTVRSRGARVVAGGFDVHHHSRGGYGDLVQYRRTEHRWRAKWGFESSQGLSARLALVPMRLAVGNARERAGTALRHWGWRR